MPNFGASEGIPSDEETCTIKLETNHPRCWTVFQLEQTLKRNMDEMEKMVQQIGDMQEKLDMYEFIFGSIDQVFEKEEKK